MLDAPPRAKFCFWHFCANVKKVAVASASRRSAALSQGKRPNQRRSMRCDLPRRELESLRLKSFEAHERGRRLGRLCVSSTAS